MTPKEKAESLIIECGGKLYAMSYVQGAIDAEDSINEAKKDVGMAESNYWRDVKQELKNL